MGCMTYAKKKLRWQGAPMRFAVCVLLFFMLGAPQPPSPLHGHQVVVRLTPGPSCVESVLASAKDWANKHRLDLMLKFRSDVALDVEMVPAHRSSKQEIWWRNGESDADYRCRFNASNILGYRVTYSMRPRQEYSVAIETETDTISSDENENFEDLRKTIDLACRCRPAQL